MRGRTVLPWVNTSLSNMRLCLVLGITYHTSLSYEMVLFFFVFLFFFQYRSVGTHLILAFRNLNKLESDNTME